MLDEERNPAGAGWDSNPVPVADGGDLAYVIYTSGSTGEPKGVGVEHRAVARLVRGAGYVDLTEEDVVAQASNISFDAATFEVWGALLNGARLVGVAKEELLAPDTLERVLKQRRVGVLFLTTALFNQVARERPRAFAGLKHLLFGGERVEERWVREVMDRGGPGRLLHVYGPTECTTFATWYEVRSGKDERGTVPIGNPIGNTTAYVLDPWGEPAPLGVVGELYLGGDGVARGYHGRPAATAAKFVPDPFGGEPGARLYRTGDLCLRRPDGAIEFVGRVDHQVKLRGFRIELGEVESVLASHPCVRECVVVVRPAGAGDERLVAYVAMRPGSSPATDELAGWMRAKLPEYMVPSSIVALDALPLNANGKLDRARLPEPGLSTRSLQERFVAPHGDRELEIAAVWREVLGVDQVGVHDNFFELGGHSLLLVRVQGLVKERLRRDVTMLELFQHPTVRSLAARLSGGGAPDGLRPLEGLAGRDAEPREPGLEPIAIVGMAGRFPGARDVDRFWENLRAGHEARVVFTEQELRDAGVDPALTRHPRYVNAGMFLADAEWFDEGFFGISPRDAEILDPQQRVFLECAWEALEDAACDPERSSGLIGVYAGVGANAYGHRVFANPEVLAAVGGFQVYLGNDKDFLATRVAYKLNLSGPSIGVQTACSTSLVAVHLACQALRQRECDAALAGGVSISLPQKRGYLYEEGMILSPDGHCRAFDAEASGAVGGSGAGVVVLKRLADARRDGDAIRAVILGGAVNNDGAVKVGYTAPQVNGQARVIRSAHLLAHADPGSISYVEGHGTGTPLGDPIEVAALTQAFREGTDRTEFCALGSVKTNIGHLDSAAGVTGLIKTVLMLEHREIPPSLNCTRPNPRIDFASSPFYVNTVLAPWRSRPGERLRAGVSSFGIGGTNAHVVVEEAAPQEAGDGSRRDHLLVLSAKSPAAIEQAAANLAAHLGRHPEQSLADVAWTLQTGRQAFAHRRAVPCRSHAEAMEALAGGAGLMRAEEEPRRRSVVFLFPGQGAQHVNMGLELYREEPLFRQVVDECAEHLRPHLGLDLRGVLYPAVEGAQAGATLEQTALAQPAIFVVSLALARLWEYWGIRPDALLGHSIGEYVAATLAGVFRLPDALALVAARGRLMQEQPRGSMLSVLMSRDEIQAVLGEHPGIALAAVNGPRACVVSGESAAVAALERRLLEGGVKVRPLRTSHAFHSSMMDPVVEPFVREVRARALFEPQRPFVSSRTGRWIESDRAVDPGYWGEQLRSPVLFSDGLRALLGEPHRLFLEVGPGQTLTTLFKQHAGSTGTCLAFSSLPPAAPGEIASGSVVRTLGRLWLAGVTPDWKSFNAPYRRLHARLPSYPFQRKRFWVETPKGKAGRAQPLSADRLGRSDWYYRPTWTLGDAEAINAPAQAGDDSGPWLVFVDAAGLGEAVGRALELLGQEVWRAEAGDGFAELGERRFRVAPAASGDYEALIESMRGRGATPTRIVHCWTITSGESGASGDVRDAALLDRGFFSLVCLAQALGNLLAGAPVALSVATNGLFEIEDGDVVIPAKATVLGPTRVIPLEYPDVACQCIEFGLASVQSSRLDATAAHLIHEVLRSGEEWGLVARRGRQRWLAGYERLSLPRAGEPPRPLREQGTWLITGGLGGMGLEMAEYLGRTVRANLILVSRSQFPAPEDWDGWLAAHPPDDPVGRRIRRLRAIEAAGGKVAVACADVADPDRMRVVVSQGEARFGRIHGVVHAAGVAGAGLIQLKTREAAERVLSAKVRGTWVLDQLLGDRPLDCWMLCSSLTGTLGAVGQVDYCSANAFLDAFAAARSAEGKSRTIAVAWDTWREVGMAVETELPEALRAHREEWLSRGLSSEEGTEVFGKILGLDAPRVLISTHDFHARVGRSRRRPPPDGAAASGAATPAQAQGVGAGAGEPRSRRQLEATIAAVWGRVLGIPEVGLDDNFFALGGDSLSAVRAATLLRQESGLLVKVPAIYDAPTPGLLAVRLQPHVDDVSELDSSEQRATDRLDRSKRRRRARLGG